MKVKFIQKPTGGRDFKVGDVFEAKTEVEKGYAQKYVDRGWAEVVKSGSTGSDGSAGNQQNGQK